MSQSPLPHSAANKPVASKSEPRVPPDFKARFGVVPDGPQPKMTRLQARRAKRKRMRTGMVVFALLLGTAGATAFLVAQDLQWATDTVKSIIATVVPPAKAPEAAPATETAAAPVPPAAGPVSPPASAPPPPAAKPVTPAAVAAAPPPEIEAAPLPDTEPVAAPDTAPDSAAPDTAPQDVELAVAPETVVVEEPVAAPSTPPPAPTQTAMESFALPASPVIGEVAGIGPAPKAAEPETGQTVQTEAVAEPASQTAMAVPESTPAVVPAPDAAKLLQGQAFRDCENCPDMIVVVPPAGLPPEQVARVKRPADAPALTPFAIGRFEVTFDDWARCMAGGGCAALPDDAGWGRNTRPVINVSHDEAAAQYIAWLAGVTGAAYRLPTSSEWDFAEAGGGASPQSGVPLIDAQTVCQSGNYSAAASAGPQEAQCADGFPTTAPVGSLKANVLGLHDMRGNVWEWVSDCWTPGFTYKVKDSERDCRRRLLRGGSWSSRAMLSATPAHGFEDARRASKSIGFRVARSLP